MHSTNTCPKRIRRASAFASIAGAALFVLACNSDEGKPSGTGSSSGTPLVADDAGAGDGATSSGAKKKNAEVGCAKNEDCESNLCFVGGAQAFCTLKCTADDVTTVCVSPFTGSCNKQGVCKRD